jgi:hypothetical protein
MVFWDGKCASSWAGKASVHSPQPHPSIIIKLGCRRGLQIRVFHSSHEKPLLESSFKSLFLQKHPLPNRQLIQKGECLSENSLCGSERSICLHAPKTATPHSAHTPYLVPVVWPWLLSHTLIGIKWMWWELKCVKPWTRHLTLEGFYFNYKIQRLK